MKRIPRSREIDRSFKLLRSEVKAALKQLNASAGRTMAKGSYSAAETLAGRARELQAFLVEVEALQARWRVVRSGPGKGQGGSKTPVWAYYQPILKALVALNGEATRQEVEPEVLALMESSLGPEDRNVNSSGLERWQAMIRRSRKHLVAEGWIETKPGSVWAITEAGRKAAAARIGDRGADNI